MVSDHRRGFVRTSFNRDEISLLYPIIDSLIVVFPLSDLGLPQLPPSISCCRQAGGTWARISRGKFLRDQLSSRKHLPSRIQAASHSRLCGPFCVLLYFFFHFLLFFDTRPFDTFHPAVSLPRPPNSPRSRARSGAVTESSIILVSCLNSEHIGSARSLPACTISIASLLFLCMLPLSFFPLPSSYGGRSEYFILGRMITTQETASL